MMAEREVFLVAMNWKPAGRAFTLNASKYIDEVVQETDIEPSLHKWSRYWIDERMRKIIANSFGESSSNMV